MRHQHVTLRHTLQPYAVVRSAQVQPSLKTTTCAQSPTTSHEIKQEKGQLDKRNNRTEPSERFKTHLVRIPDPNQGIGQGHLRKNTECVALLPKPGGRSYDVNPRRSSTPRQTNQAPDRTNPKDRPGNLHPRHRTEILCKPECRTKALHTTTDNAATRRN